tara:strand:+ start:52927 stop:53904 length:978 start_codon:yes stop_codon:yes gene_type:complete
MDKLIINYLIGEISLEDQHKLKKWLEEDESHPVILEQMEKFWAQGEMKFPDRKQAVFSRLKSEIDKLEESDQFTKPSNRFTLGQLLRYAAVVLIASLISIYAYISFEVDIQRTRSTINYLEKVSSPGQKITTTLPDGTKVKLNSESKIIVPEHFPADIREVTLMGEAFFEVVPDPNKPFIVHFNNNEVEVLGTSFNIKAYDNRQSYVAVKTGKVSVKQGQDQVQLNPHEITSLGGSALTVNKLRNEEMIFGWVDNKITFEKASITEVMEIISNWYGVEYEIRRKIDENKRYTASHSNPTLKEVMEILTYTYDIKYEIDDNTIIIK